MAPVHLRRMPREERVVEELGDERPQGAVRREQALAADPPTWEEPAAVQHREYRGGPFVPDALQGLYRAVVTPQRDRLGRARRARV